MVSFSCCRSSPLSELSVARQRELGNLSGKICAAFDVWINASTKCLQGKVFAQVGLADFGIGENLLGAALGDHPAFADDIGPLADIQGFTHIVVGDQYADTFVAEVADDHLDI